MSGPRPRPYTLQRATSDADRTNASSSGTSSDHSSGSTNTSCGTLFGQRPSIDKPVPGLPAGAAQPLPGAFFPKAASQPASKSRRTKASLKKNAPLPTPPPPLPSKEPTPASRSWFLFSRRARSAPLPSSSRSDVQPPSILATKEPIRHLPSEPPSVGQNFSSEPRRRVGSKPLPRLNISELDAVYDVDRTVGVSKPLPQTPLPQTPNEGPSSLRPDLSTSDIGHVTGTSERRRTIVFSPTASAPEVHLERRMQSTQSRVGFEHAWVEHPQYPHPYNPPPSSFRLAEGPPQRPAKPRRRWSDLFKRKKSSSSSYPSSISSASVTQFRPPWSTSRQSSFYDVGGAYSDLGHGGTTPYSETGHGGLATYSEMGHSTYEFGMAGVGSGAAAAYSDLGHGHGSSSNIGHSQYVTQSELGHGYAQYYSRNTATAAYYVYSEAGHGQAFHHPQPLPRKPRKLTRKRKQSSTPNLSLPPMPPMPPMPPIPTLPPMPPPFMFSHNPAQSTSVLSSTDLPTPDVIRRPGIGPRTPTTDSLVSQCSLRPRATSMPLEAMAFASGPAPHNDAEGESQPRAESAMALAHPGPCEEAVSSAMSSKSTPLLALGRDKQSVKSMSPSEAHARSAFGSDLAYTYQPLLKSPGKKLKKKNSNPARRPERRRTISEGVINLDDPLEAHNAYPPHNSPLTLDIPEEPTTESGCTLELPLSPQIHSSAVEMTFDARPPPLSFVASPPDSPDRPSFLRTISNRRWTLAVTDLPDEPLYAEVTRLKQTGWGVDEEGQLELVEGGPSRGWDGLLVCRELIRTEKTYLRNLEILARGDTNPCAPPLMLSYLPALLRASTLLIAGLIQDPSPWGASAAFLGAEEFLEPAFVAWAGIIGQFFSGTKSGAMTPSKKRERKKSRGTSIYSESEKEVRMVMRDVAIQPTQRVVRYVLLYKDLLKHTPLTSLSRPLVERALEGATRIAQRCNRAQDNAAFLISKR